MYHCGGGIVEERTGPLRVIEITNAGYQIAAVTAYGRLVVTAGPPYPPRPRSAYEAGFQKRKEASRVFNALGTLALILFLTVLLTTIIPKNML